MKILKNGITLIHEHTTIDLSRIKNTDDTNLDCFEETVEEFKNLYDLGVRNIVDLTAIGMGRNIEYKKRVEELSGINIISSTGFYKEPFLPELVKEKNAEELASIMIDEIKNGIDGTNEYPKVIGEIGTSKDEITNLEEKVFIASILAAKETGVVISTHSSLGTMALEQASLFEKYNFNPSRVIIGHQDLSGNLDQIIDLINRGFYVGFDTIGKNNYYPDEKRADMLYQLQEKNLIDKIVLSMDITRKSSLKYKGGIGYTYLFTDFLPILKKKKVTEASIRKMLVENPKDIFEGGFNESISIKKH